MAGGTRPNISRDHKSKKSYHDGKHKKKYAKYTRVRKIQYESK